MNARRLAGHLVFCSMMTGVGLAALSNHDPLDWALWAAIAGTVGVGSWRGCYRPRGKGAAE